MDQPAALTPRHGVLVVDKPRGLSSAACVDKVRRALGATRAGHGGTLDPLATGVLAVCLGAATKLAPYLLADDKAYEAEGVLGVETDTLDRTGTVTATRDVAVTRDQLLAAIAARTGEQEQVPPMYSALKQGGERLYDLARAGVEVERRPRAIRIDRLELLRFEPPRFAIAIDCTKGTYVRSLVADLGTDVGCGAHLAELRRTRSGRFTLDRSITLDDVLAGADVSRALVPMREAVTLPEVVVHGDQITSIRSGVQLPVDRMGAENLERFQFVDEHGRMLAVAHAFEGKVIYDRVFPEMFPEP
ncbi:MAG: tRNA pseudouridine(55) synthase TruB [Kofleriaceae bacterium]